MFLVSREVIQTSTAPLTAKHEGRQPDERGDIFAEKALPAKKASQQIRGPRVKIAALRG